MGGFEAQPQAQEGGPYIKETDESRDYLAEPPKNIEEVRNLISKVSEGQLTGKEYIKVLSQTVRSRIDEVNKRLKESHEATFSGLDDKEVRLVTEKFAEELQEQEEKLKKQLSDYHELFEGDELDKQKAELIKVYITNWLEYQLKEGGPLEDLMETVDSLDADEAAVAAALSPKGEKMAKAEEEKEEKPTLGEDTVNKVAERRRKQRRAAGF